MSSSSISLASGPRRLGGLLVDLSTLKEMLILCWTRLSVSAILIDTVKTTIADAPKADAASLSREERFLQFYLAAFQGLHSQFTHSIWADLKDGHAYVSCADTGEKPQRSKRLAQIAWYSATAACQLFDDQAELAEFNEKC